MDETGGQYIKWKHPVQTGLCLPQVKFTEVIQIYSFKQCVGHYKLAALLLVPLRQWYMTKPVLGSREGGWIQATWKRQAETRETRRLERSGRGREMDGRKVSNNVYGAREMAQVKSTGCSESRFSDSRPRGFGALSASVAIRHEYHT